MTNNLESLKIIVADENGNWVKLAADENDPTLWENLNNPGRWMGEKFFSSYHEKMQALRGVDNQIKNWVVDLDKCYNHAKKAIKESRILDALFWLSQINLRLKTVSGFKSQITNLHFEDFDKRHGNTSEEMGNYLDFSQTRKKEAGLRQMLSDWHINRMYEQELSKQKKALDILMNSVRQVIGHVKSYLSQMEMARKSGNIASYVKNLNGIAATQQKFEAEYISSYDENFKEMVNRIQAKKKLEEQRKKNQPAPVEEENIPVPLVNVKQQPELPATPPAAVPAPQMKEEAPAQLPEQPKFVIPDLDVKEKNSPVIPDLEVKKPTLAPAVPAENLAPFGEVVDKTKELPEGKPAKKPAAPKAKKKAEHQFIANLEKYAAEDNLAKIAGEILVYSAEIEDEDFETSMKLLAVAEGILDV